MPKMIGYEKDVPGGTMMPANQSPGGVGGRTRKAETMDMPEAHLGMKGTHQGYLRRSDAINEQRGSIDDPMYMKGNPGYKGAGRTKKYM